MVANTAHTQGRVVGLVAPFLHEHPTYSEYSPSKFMSGLGRNAGNILFQESVRRSIAAQTRFVGWSTDPDALQDLSCIVIPAANWLGTHADLGHLADTLSAVDIPIAVVGIGIQNQVRNPNDVHPSVRAFLESVQGASRRHSILTRGPLSSAALRILGHESTPIGCPSNWLSHEANIGQTMLDRYSEPRGHVSGTLGNPAIPEHVRVDRQLLALAADPQTRASIIAQEEPFVSLIRDGTQAEATLRSLSIRLELSESDLKTVMTGQGRVFASAEEWRDHHRRSSLVLGTRLHGAMAGIQSGAPSVLFWHDDRTKEVAEFTGIPNRSIPRPRVSIVKAADKVLQSFSASSYDARRIELLDRYIEAMEGLGVPMKPTLKSLVHATRKDRVWPRTDHGKAPSHGARSPVAPHSYPDPG